MDCVERVLSMWPGDQMRTVEVRGSLPLTSDWDYSDNGDGQALAAHSTSALALPPDFPIPALCLPSNLSVFEKACEKRPGAPSLVGGRNGNI